MGRLVLTRVYVYYVFYIIFTQGRVGYDMKVDKRYEVKTVTYGKCDLFIYLLDHSIEKITE